MAETPSAAAIGANSALAADFGFGTPAPYPYGWFGPHYRTRRVDQTGFYGYYYQYGYWQGYY